MNVIVRGTVDTRPAVLPEGIDFAVPFVGDIHR